MTNDCSVFAAAKECSQICEQLNDGNSKQYSFIMRFVHFLAFLFGSQTQTFFLEKIEIAIIAEGKCSDIKVLR